MQPCLRTLTERLAELTDAIDSTPGITNWRGRVIGYRDHRVDGPDWLEEKPFVSTGADLKAQLSELTARGGGDEPESSLDALFHVASMESSTPGHTRPDRWRAQGDAARVVAIFSDATFHSSITAEIGREGQVSDVITALNSARVAVNIFAPDQEEDVGWSELGNHFPYTPLDGAGPEEWKRSLRNLASDPIAFNILLHSLAKSISASAAQIGG